MKAYLVFETERQFIAVMDTLSIILFAMAAALFAFAVGMWIDELILGRDVEIIQVTVPILCGMALVFYCLGFWAVWSRYQTWKAIRKACTSSES